MKPPLLYLEPLTQRVYLTFHYKEHFKELGRDMIEVTGKKYDVTDQFGQVLADMDEAGIELRRVPS